MSDFDSHQERELNPWLDYQNHTLVIDIIGALEIGAGLREVLISARQADLVVDLVRCLDIEAGLGAIVPVVTTTEQVNAEEAKSGAILREFLQGAAFWNTGTRLATRTHPIFSLTGFHERTQTLFLNLRSAGELAGELDRELDRVLRRFLDRALHLDDALEQALDLHLDRNLEHARDLGHDLDRNLDLARSIARDLSQDLPREVALLPGADHLPTHILDRALTRALDQALHLDHALDHSLDHSNHARIGARFLARSLDRVRALARGLDRVCTVAGELAGTTQTVVHFHDMFSDVIDVDLRGVDLAGITLEGLRWSTMTRWPPNIEDQISRNSVETAPGIFEVSRRSSTHVLTRGSNACHELDATDISAQLGRW
jgi:hypothetical protein